MGNDMYYNLTIRLGLGPHSCRMCSRCRRIHTETGPINSSFSYLGYHRSLFSYPFSNIIIYLWIINKI